MFYETAKNNHGLPHDPLKAIVAPRPIGWISSLDENGVANLAPYSFFNLVAAPPPVVMFASGTVKDSQNNIEKTGEFVCNLATAALADAVNDSSAHVPPDVDEFDVARIEKAPSRLVKPPRVAASPAHLECVYLQTVVLPHDPKTEIQWSMVLGKVVAVHIADEFIKDGLVDTAALTPLSRLGYLDYGLLGEVFSKARPDRNELAS